MESCSQASEDCKRAPHFTCWTALQYLAGMKSYWILVLGLGVWAAANEIVFSYMPAFQGAQFLVKAPQNHCCAHYIYPDEQFQSHPTVEHA